MKIHLKHLLIIALVFFAFHKVTYSQESGFTKFVEKDLGYSISYPDIWIRESADSSTPYVSLNVSKDVDGVDYIGLSVISVKGTSTTAEDYDTNLLKNPTFIEPLVIENKCVKWVAHDAVRIQIEYAAPQLNDRVTAYIYYALVDKVSYNLLFQCRKVYFPQFKPIMEKVAQTFSILPTTGTEKPIQKQVVPKSKSKPKFKKKRKTT